MMFYATEPPDRSGGSVAVLLSVGEAPEASSATYLMYHCKG